MSRYLYGASVQGIQEFIFKTNDLKSIIGASEIVELIATSFSNEFEKNCEVIQKAAGNIKILFNDKKDVENIVLNFPKKVSQSAYGITISQAVVSVKNDLSKDDIDKLEEKLKIARNKPSLPLDSNISIIKVSPTTGRAITKVIVDKKNKDKKEYLDYATQIKRETEATNLTKKLTDKTLEFPKELSNISNSKNKIAIIHADGNGLGKLLQNLSKKLQNDTNIKDVFKKFSTSLDKATTQAAKDAFKKLPKEKNSIKFRPIILGGDDLSVICSADFALEFTKDFLSNFQIQTKQKLKWLQDDYGVDFCKDGLTACAGVAFCNEKYPFHYAISLAEELCSYAKKQSKKIDDNLAPSSIMFHNIQSSYFISFEDYKKEELEFDDISFVYGPYFLDKTYGATIESFLNLVYCLNSENLPKSRLRKWLSELYFDKTYAKSLLKRINQVIDSKAKDATNKALKPFNIDLENLFINKDGKKYTPIHDAIEIASITGESRCKFI